MYLVKSKHSSCICPSCHTLSHRIHSQYVRSLQDVPAYGKTTYIKIQTRKFFCDDCSCPQAIFTRKIYVVRDLSTQNQTFTRDVKVNRTIYELQS
ncbi:transposase family protein, partial [Priestia megaterium]|uniref:transposase family protein n=1 Tax=Priestia megaterium TaxID=1404 RepID=UPI0039B689B7